MTILDRGSLNHVPDFSTVLDSRDSPCPEKHRSRQPRLMKINILKILDPMPHALWSQRSAGLL